MRGAQTIGHHRFCVTARQCYVSSFAYATIHLDGESCATALGGGLEFLAGAALERA